MFEILDGSVPVVKPLQGISLGGKTEVMPLNSSLNATDLIIKMHLSKDLFVSSVLLRPDFH